MGVSFTLSPRSLPLSEDPTATVSLVVPSTSVSQSEQGHDGDDSNGAVSHLGHRSV